MRGARARTAATAVLLGAGALIAASLLAACGGDEPTETVATTPTGPTGPTGGEGEKTVSETDADQPGAPDPGDPLYTALGSYWTELPIDQRVASAAKFIEDNPDACGGVAPGDLERQTGLAFGLDFPLNVPAADAMLETCAVLRDGG